MVEAGIRGDRELGAVAALGNRLQSAYRFCIASEARSDVPVTIVPGLRERPFIASRTGVTLTRAGAKDIAAYLGITEEQYLLTGAMLGILQYRALVLNPLLYPEDLLHAPGNGCPYSAAQVNEYILSLEAPRICPGCLRFLRTLVPAEEADALSNVFNALPAAGKESRREGCRRRQSGRVSVP